MSICAYLTLGIVVWTLIKHLKRTAPPRLKLISRGPIQLIGWQELAEERRALLHTERDRIDAYESRQYREYLARCARKSQHQS